MNTRYTSLFRISVAHSYYASTICECVSYQPSATTTTLMSVYGFMLRTTNDGFELFTNTNQTVKDYLNYIKQVSGTSAFEFYGITSDEDFYNFTDIPVNELGTLSYTSNQTIATSSNNEIQLEQTFITATTTQETVNITITFDDIIHLQQAQDSLLFRIQMQARETQWNYYIINNASRPYEQLTIESGTENIQFSTPTEVTLQNGQKALLFSSGTTTIPLKNKVTHKFTLVNMKTTLTGERKEILVKELPIPDPKNLQIQNEHTIASSIYVYI